MKTAASFLAFIAPISQMTGVNAFSIVPAEIGKICPHDDDYYSGGNYTKGIVCDSSICPIENCLVRNITAGNGTRVIDCECHPEVDYGIEKGQECNYQHIVDSGYNVITSCCQSENKDNCPEYKHCRVASVEDMNVKCECVAAPKINNSCDNSLYYNVTQPCNEDCESCRVTVIGDGMSDIKCECEETTVTCTGSGNAYDNCNYCRHPPCAVVPGATDKFEISVCGDATYEIDLADKPNQGICGGSGAIPVGKLCPKQGDKAVKHCEAHRDNIFSRLAHVTAECVAPEDAVCVQLKDGDVWGCVFPSNSNQANGCLVKDHCMDKHVKYENQCKVTANGYLIINATAPDYFNTSTVEKSEPVVDSLNLKTDNDGNFSILTNVVSLIVGMFTTALSIFASL